MICRGAGVPGEIRGSLLHSFLSAQFSRAIPGLVNNGTSFSLKVLVWIVDDGVPRTFPLGPQYLVGQAESRAVTEA